MPSRWKIKNFNPACVHVHVSKAILGIIAMCTLPNVVVPVCRINYVSLLRCVFHVTVGPVYTCGSNEFTCDDGYCVQRDYVCDNQADCPDGSDEKDCRKSSQHSPVFLILVYFVSFYLCFLGCFLLSGVRSDPNMFSVNIEGEGKGLQSLAVSLRWTTAVVPDSLVVGLVVLQRRWPLGKSRVGWLHLTSWQEI